MFFAEPNSNSIGSIAYGDSAHREYSKEPFDDEASKNFRNVEHTQQKLENLLEMWFGTMNTNLFAGHYTVFHGTFTNHQMTNYN